MIRLVVLLALLSDSLSIRISPQVVMAGGTIRITCHVPKSTRNRVLDMGIDGYLIDRVQLDGADAPVTHQKFYNHVPCGIGQPDDESNWRAVAYCRVVDWVGKEQAVTAPFAVGGCSESR